MKQKSDRRKAKVKALNPAQISATLVDIAQSDVETVLRSLDSSQSGLSPSESQRRIQRFGFNEIASEKPPHWSVQLLKTFANPLAILLLTLAVLSWITGDPRAAAIIFI